MKRGAQRMRFFLMEESDIMKSKYAVKANKKKGD